MLARMKILPGRWCTSLLVSFLPQHIRYTHRSSSSHLFMSTSPSSKAITVVQYLFLRRDLAWPAGAMAAQAAHASVAAIITALQHNSDDANYYISNQNLPHMTKLVYGVENEEHLKQVQAEWSKLIASMREGSSEQEEQCYLWIEQPENIPTALATWPIQRTNKVSKTIKKLNLPFF